MISNIPSWPCQKIKKEKKREEGWKESMFKRSVLLGFFYYNYLCHHCWLMLHAVICYGLATMEWLVAVKDADIPINRMNATKKGREKL